MEQPGGYLDSNQAVPKDDVKTQPGEYTPSSEEKKTVQMVNKLFDAAKKHRKKYDHKWMDYYKMFRGKQWKEDRPSYRHSAVFNLVFRVIQSQVPVQTDTRPQFDFLPQEPSDRAVAEIMSEVAASDWQRNNWLMNLCEIIYDANFYGTSFGDVPFEPEEKLGLGDIGFNSVDPFYCFPDPDAPNINHKKSKHFIYAEPINVDVLKKEYPDKAKFLKADMIDFIKGDKTEISTSTYKSPTDNNMVIDQSGEQLSNQTNKALKIILWIKDDTVIEESQDLSSDGSVADGQNAEEANAVTTQFVQKKKYPNGRKICISNNVLLDDGPNPYDDGRFPYARYVNYMLPREFFGISEIEQIEGPQVIYNKIFSFVLDVLTLMGNPIWVVDNDSGVDTDNLFNRPGMVVEPNAGTRVERVEGVGLQPYVLNILQLVGDSINDIAGNNDVSRGLKPEGVTAASAIKELQDSAQTRLRQKARFLDAFLQEVGQLYASRVFQFRSAPQIYRLTNDQNVTKYFKFHIEKQALKTGDEIKIAKYRPMVEQPDGSSSFGEEQQYQIMGEFDIKVSTGSSLPFAKQEKASLAFQLFDRQVIDAEEVLKTVEWPNKEAVLERLKQNQAMQSQAQAQGQRPA
jgi:hypothetical protein